MWLEVKNFALVLIAYGHIFTFRRYMYQAYGAIAGKGAAGGFTRDYSKSKLVGILGKTYISAMKGLPKMIKKRRLIQRNKLKTPREVFELLKMYGIDSRTIALKG